MDIYEELELQDCPYCRGPGVLEEEGGWCWYVMWTAGPRPRLLSSRPPRSGSPLPGKRPICGTSER